jgi:hypothetical protein
MADADDDTTGSIYQKTARAIPFWRRTRIFKRGGTLLIAPERNPVKEIYVGLALAILEEPGGEPARRREILPHGLTLGGRPDKLG